MATSYYLVGLTSVLLSIVHIDCRCEKVTEDRLIDIPHYRTQVVQTNACKETSSATLMPQVSMGDDNRRAFIKRYHDSCCCVITSNTREQVLLRPVAPTRGRSSILVNYRRIESCGCVRCDVANAMEDGIDIEYSD